MLQNIWILNMEIYLLRHGTSLSNEQRLVCGASDYPLSDYGIDQSEKVCKILSKIAFSKIYSSPLSRAIKTIEKLNRSVNVTITEEITELNTGDFSHISVDQLWANYPRYRYQGLNPNLKYPNGECLNDMLYRIKSWFEKERINWKMEEKILIVGHEGTICGILHHILSLPIDNYPTFVIGNCDYVQISINSDFQIRHKFFPFLSRI